MKKSLKSNTLHSVLTYAVVIFIAVFIFVAGFITGCSTNALRKGDSLSQSNGENKNNDGQPEITEVFGEDLSVESDSTSEFSPDELSSTQSVVDTELEDKDIYTLKTPELFASLDNGELQQAKFTEVWGYVTSGMESSLNTSYPITDVAYFGAGVNNYGELSGVPKRSKLSSFKGRVHLVVIDSGAAFSHMVLSDELPMRKKFIEKLVNSATDYDGVQIDFETIPARDIENYYSFLKEIKSKIGDKILSIAIPARTRVIKEDTFNYPLLATIADRIIVMAYDEHWSGGTPGPVASLSWCKKIASYAKSVIPAEKLIMGLPLYGRAWTDDDTPGAYRMSTIEKLINGEHGETVYRKNGDAYIKFQVTANISLYFEDFQSIFDKLIQYQDTGVQSVAFWRLGLEDPDMWKLISTVE